MKCGEGKNFTSQLKALSKTSCRRAAKLSPGVQTARIFLPSLPRGGHLQCPAERSDAIERDHGTEAGQPLPTRRRRYNVKEVKNLLFEAGDKRLRGRGVPAFLT